MSEEHGNIWFLDGQSLAGPGAYDAGHGVSYTPFYLDAECKQLGGLYMWHPCPLTRERLQLEDDDMSGIGPNAATNREWGYTNEHDIEHVTLEGSVLDPECGWHGFIRNGKWEPCQ